jgi:hypothetical protein
MNIDENDIALIVFFLFVAIAGIIVAVFRGEFLKVWEWIT